MRKGGANLPGVQGENGGAILSSPLFSIPGVLSEVGAAAILSFLCGGGACLKHYTTGTLCQERPQRALAGVQGEIMVMLFSPVSNCFCRKPPVFRILYSHTFIH